MSEAEILLTKSLQESQQRVQVLEEILRQRAGATGGEVIDWLGFSLRAARAGDPAARRALARLTEQLDEARGLARGLEVVRTFEGQPPAAG